MLDLRACALAKCFAIAMDDCDYGPYGANGRQEYSYGRLRT